MLLFAESIFQGKTIELKLRILCNILLYGFRLGFKKFRSKERKRSRNLCDCTAAFIVHGLIFRYAVIFIFFHCGINKSMFQLAENTVFCFESIIECMRRLRDFSLETAEIRRFLHAFLKVFFP